MSRYSIDEFLKRTMQKDHGEGFFELESDRMLEVNLGPDGRLVWTKVGSMIAFLGGIKFAREGMLDHGIGKAFKRAMTGEGTSLMKAEGRGKLYLADGGKKITILELAGEKIIINANDVLAFQDGISWDIKMMKKLTAMMAGGLFNIELQGHGMVAITTHYEPLTLRVGSQRPVITDPNATVAWSGNLTPEWKSDVSLKTFLGRGSGESIQMMFRGEGFVVVQPYEEVVYQGQG